MIYEIYPRSFQDSNGDGVGDLNGVTRRLDYLKQLGVDAIWLTPFYPSPNADFGYDVADYTNVAPEYGTLADWDRLVREARKRGLRILVDLVLNHSSDQHPWFKESRASRDNPKRDWYVWRGGSGAGGPPTNWESIFGGSTWTYDDTTRQWYYHIFLPQQPDFNWASAGLQQAMFDVVRFWLNHGASGFRLDATPYLFEDPAWPQDPDPKSGAPVWLKPYNSGRPETHRVLHDLRTILDGYPNERVLLGESATASIEELAATYGAHHDEINLPMDFLFGNLTHLDAGVFKHQIDDAELRLNGDPPVFFFSSHDHPRQWSSFGDGPHNDDIAKLTAALTLTPRGTALLYYGEELGMGDLPSAQLAAAPLSAQRPRADDRDRARAPMQWTGAAGAGFSTVTPWLPVADAAGRYNLERERGDPNSIYLWYARLLKLRHDNPDLHDGAYLPLESENPHVLAFARSSAGAAGVLMVFNMSAAVQTAEIRGWPGATPVLGSVLLANPAPAQGTASRMTLPGYGVSIISLHAGATAPDATPEFRPRYHFSPARNWMNDPNGLVWIDGTYHLFYQYNPFGARWGHMSWGHARSRDLYHWEELPVALTEDDSYMIFSGSVVVDAQNSSGFAQTGESPLVAVYTGSRRSGAELQNQQLAYSNDAASTWTKYADNPVLDLSSRAFRDPEVFWYEPAHQWIMVAVLSDAHRVTFYGSNDLKRWQHLSDFGPLGAADGAWECPDLFALPVTNAPGEVRWVLKVDVFKSTAAAGSGAQYFVGTFDGRAFTIDSRQSPQPVDYGKDFYAAASWSHLPDNRRHVWIGWMSNHEYAQDVPTAPWRGAMSVPREVSLRRSPTGYELLQAPAPELDGLRRRHRHRSALTLHGGRATTLIPALRAAAEIVATLEPRDADEFGLQVRVGAHEETVIGYDVKSQRLFVDRSRAGRSDFNSGFARRHWAPLALDGALRLHVLLDRSSVEVFAGDGQRVFTELVFPAAGSLGLRAYARRGAAVLRDLDVWDIAAEDGGCEEMRGSATRHHARSGGAASAQGGGSVRCTNRRVTASMISRQ